MDVILILGGARSGKSVTAEKLAMQFGANVLYIATAEIGDEEMASRIALHRKKRPKTWITIEAPTDLEAALGKIKITPDVIVLDCLTLLASNILLAGEGQPDAEIEATLNGEIDALLAFRQRANCPLIVVSNEVGLGIIPDNPLGRIYRDILGRANQRIAAVADQVILMVAGIPLEIKP